MLYHIEVGKKSNPAIVLLHGGGLSSKMWGPVIERLEPNYHILAPDMPEQGQSAGVKPFTLKGTAEMVAELIRLKVLSKKAHLVGNSLGGAVALTMCSVCPEVVETALSQGTGKIGKTLLAIGKLQMGLVGLFKPETLAKLTVQQLGLKPEQYGFVYDDLVISSNTSFTLRLLEAIASLELPVHNPRPLLAVVGEKETPAARAVVKDLAKLPNTTAVIVPKLHHLMAVQDPDVFCAIVRAWVERKPLPATLRVIQAD